MTLQNRVQPDGQITADTARGTLMGNRGILHDAHQSLGPRRWQHQAWVTCLLEFKDRRRALMTPNRYTELFFLDEPTALAAGHRPCGECRRAQYRLFKTLFNACHDTQTITQIDRLMHSHRVTRTRQHIHHNAPAHTLPDGAMIALNDQPHLIWGEHIHRYSPAGYTAKTPRPDRTVIVLTPACTIATLQAGYQPTPHFTVAG